ncbi:MAG: hypothetical protein [Olavius algarvensis spirochete endosymbiont]|nr:MAG: hypothetical protein [Olavius algarvensis spirochete endosymbiont]
MLHTFFKIPSQNFVQEIKDIPTSKNTLNSHFLSFCSQRNALA